MKSSLSATFFRLLPLQNVYSFFFPLSLNSNSFDTFDMNSSEIPIQSILLLVIEFCNSNFLMSSKISKSLTFIILETYNPRVYSIIYNNQSFIPNSNIMNWPKGFFYKILHHEKPEWKWREPTKKPQRISKETIKKPQFLCGFLAVSLSFSFIQIIIHEHISIDTFYS